MKYKHSVLGLVAGTALMLAGGCSKQDSTGTPAADHGAKASSAATGGSAPAVPALKTAENQPAAAASANVNAAPATPTTYAATAPATNAVAAVPVKATADPTAAASAVTTGSASNATLKSAVQDAVRTQQQTVAQSATNRVQALAQAGTNRWQSLAAGLTNQAMTALGTTNQVPSSGTNQVQVLLERAKTLSDNQKYQEALGTLTQLYNNKLTPEQKLRADDLKTQIQSNITQKATSAASSALGTFFGGKK